MGKSGGRKKKSGNNQNQSSSPQPVANGGVNLDSSVLLKRAHEIKEEGNRMFQSKDYVGALLRYEKALELTPRSHPDRAVFHSNRAACLMQMKPIDYDAVVSEFTLALHVQPRYVGALVRRARVFEAMGKYEMAYRDVEYLLSVEPNHGDALEIGERLRVALGVHQDLQSCPSPEALGAPICGQAKDSGIRLRPLKLAYDQDIRLAQVPVNCSFKGLREVVGRRFPMSKSVLIKYKDNDGDLVTITCTPELRMAEACVDSLIAKDRGVEEGDSVGLLRLHIVEVSPEHEPPLLEGEEENPLGNEVSEVGEAIDETEKISDKEKSGRLDDPDSKDMEIDDWLFEFAQLFKNHVGIDPDARIDLNEIGMELSSDTLEDAVTSEGAQILFDKAALKFQEVAALAFFNWGNVHMCAARKRIPIDDMADNLQTAYDWVRGKYSLAREKYDAALSIKPDFYEGLLALGQQQFELAKLHWSFVIAKKEDLSKWDPTETISLFDGAEEKMKAAAEMWEKLEEQRANELKDPEEAAEQAAVMRSQIHLFRGNMLFERSQVEFKLGMPGWKKNLDDAAERFKLAGASEDDISTVLKNHCSN